MIHGKRRSVGLTGDYSSASPVLIGELTIQFINCRPDFRPSSMESRLCRSDRDAFLIRDLREGFPVQFASDVDAFVWFTQASQSRCEAIFQHNAFDESSTWVQFVRSNFKRDPHVLERLPFTHFSADPPGNHREPRFESRGVRKLVRCFVRRKNGFRKGIFSVGMISTHSNHLPQNGILVRSYQLGEFAVRHSKGRLPKPRYRER